MTATEMETSASATDGESPVASTGSPPAVKNGNPSVNESAERRKEAMNQFVAGKRHLLVKDINSAVTSLGQACELLSEEYGETAYEVADAHYYYGKALLEMARAEAGVFGNALDGVPDGEDSDNSQVEDPEKMTEDEREDVEKKVGEALEENFSALKEKEEKKAKLTNGTEETTEDETEEDEEEEGAEGGEAEDGDGAAEDGDGAAEKGAADEKDSEKEKETAADSPKDTDSVGGADAETKESEDQKEQEAEDEEDPSNLQLSWEMLEVAKLVYTKHIATLAAKAEEKKAVEAKLCETLLTLGEVSLESENYEQAVSDIGECLEKRKASLPEDSRRIAETHYHLGVALGLHNKFDEAVKSLQDAVAVLKKRVANLKNKSESVDESKASDAFYTRETEITEIESLIPEIEEKIQDTKDSKDQTEKNTKEEEGFSKNGESSGAKPVSSISIKRKADGAESASPTKKLNGEAVVNGKH